jgi:O-antigen ligase
MPLTLRRLRFDWQILPLLLAAIWGLVAAYSTRLALVEFGLVLLGVALYFLLANLPDPVRVGGKSRSVLAGLLAVLPLALSLYFLLTNDWLRSTGKLTVLQPVLEVLAANPLRTIGPGLNPNSFGGAIAVLLPLQVFAVRRTRRWLAVTLVAVSLAALLLSEARGAWLALALAASARALWNLIAARVTGPRRARAIWMFLAVTCGVVCVAALVLTPLGGWLLERSGDRLNIWRNSFSLARDYAFTGVGLGSYEMAYASYALLTHVGYVSHAHNLLLDVWLGLGAVGLLALAGLALNAAWPKPSSPWRAAALVSLLVMLVHGAVDDALWGYQGFLIPVTFIPLALLIRPAESSAARRTFQPALAVWLAAAVGLAVALITPSGRAALEADWGALRQTRAELSVYRWPDIPMQDVLRQNSQGEIASAAGFYQHAIDIDPGNATAQWRLGQIDLAQGQYAEACRHLAAAYGAAPEQRAIRQLLGECDALDGRVDLAVELWRTIDTSEEQLTLRSWWYETYLGDAECASRLNLAIAALQVRQAAELKTH